VEKSAATSGLLRHDVRVGGGRIAHGTQAFGVDPVFAAVGQNRPAQGILAHQAGGEEREGAPSLARSMSTL